MQKWVPVSQRISAFGVSILVTTGKVRTPAEQYVFSHLFQSYISWQALREDVRRQTDREHQLQTRYSHLLYDRDANYNQMQQRH